MSYWVVRRNNMYWGGHRREEWWYDRLNAWRYRLREDAVYVARQLDGARIVRVVTRPRSERLYLCERLAAWEPVVRAACEWAGDDGASEEGIYHAVRAMPKEHMP